jgi:hypothetical protein
VVSLYESLHTGILGGFVVTAAQIAFVPVAVVWMVAWFAGPGFAIGADAVISPFVTTVGAVPAIPLLGIIPESTVVGGWVTVIPGLIALIAAARFSPWIGSHGRVFNPGSAADVGRVAITAVVAAAVVGSVAVVVGASTAVLLHLRPQLHSLARGLGEHDMRAIMQFVAVALVVLPVLPDRTFGPFAVLNPHRMWWMVVLITGISLASYVAFKVLGPRGGNLAAGLLGAAPLRWPRRPGAGRDRQVTGGPAP